MSSAREIGGIETARRLGHIAVATALGFGLPSIAALAATAAPSAPQPGSLAWLYLQHTLQAALAVVAILSVRRAAPAEYGLRWPRGGSYARMGVLGGIAFGALSCLALLLISGRPPCPSYVPTPAAIAGWLAFQGVYVGPTEEVLFRGLIIGYLSATVPTRLRIGRLDLSLGAVVSAIIFALSHWSYGTAPAVVALGQQIYAFALGLFYAYCFERSGSLLAPILAHNASDTVVALAQLGGLLAGAC
jgi:membrane protease YdiL (CAAX protease family)